MKDLFTDFLANFRILVLLFALGFLATVLFVYLSNMNKKPKEPTLLKGLTASVKTIVKEKVMVTHDTMRLTLSFPGSNLLLGLPIGNHIRVL